MAERGNVERSWRQILRMNETLSSYNSRGLLLKTIERLWKYRFPRLDSEIDTWIRFFEFVFAKKKKKKKKKKLLDARLELPNEKWRAARQVGGDEVRTERMQVIERLRTYIPTYHRGEYKRDVGRMYVRERINFEGAGARTMHFLRETAITDFTLQTQ